MNATYALATKPVDEHVSDITLTHAFLAADWNHVDLLIS